MSVDAAVVVTIVQRELDLDDGDVTATSTAEEIEFWDSLGHLRICMAIEETVGVSIPMDAVGELMSVPAIVNYLNGAGNE